MREPPPLFFLDEIQVASRSNSSLGRTNGSGTARAVYDFFLVICFRKLQDYAPAAPEGQTCRLSAGPHEVQRNLT